MMCDCISQVLNEVVNLMLIIDVQSGPGNCSKNH